MILARLKPAETARQSVVAPGKVGQDLWPRSSILGPWLTPLYVPNITSVWTVMLGIFWGFTGVAAVMFDKNKGLPRECS